MVKKGTLHCFSILIPARNEEECIQETVREFYQALVKAEIVHEILVVDDGSTDSTWQRLQELKKEVPSLQCVKNEGRNGFGRALAVGLSHVAGDAVTIVMADASDDPADAIAYWEKLQEGHDCVFGSRFITGSQVVDYPMVKLILNRLANLFIQLLFQLPFNDTTNAFKAYRMDVIRGLHPILSPHFNITVELPLKAIVRGYQWASLPIRWKHRKRGESKLKIKEMGSRYLFICLYVWLEKHLSMGDYKKGKDV